MLKAKSFIHYALRVMVVKHTITTFLLGNKLLNYLSQTFLLGNKLFIYLS